MILIPVLNFLFIYFTIYAVSIIIHEMGHLWYFNERLNKKVKLRFFKRNLSFGWKVGHKADYIYLTLKQYFFVNFYGVFSGLIAISVMALFIHHVYLWVIPAYLMGCRQDITEMVRTLWHHYLN